MIYKVVLIGTKGAGKSALVERIVNNKFKDSDFPRDEIGFVRTTIPAECGEIELAFWDPGFQCRSYHTLMANVSVILFCVDQSNVNALKDPSLLEYCPADAIKILVPTKADQQAKISNLELEVFSAEKKFILADPVSAKRGENIINLTQKISSQLSQRARAASVNTDAFLALVPTTARSRSFWDFFSCCCAKQPKSSELTKNLLVSHNLR